MDLEKERPAILWCRSRAEDSGISKQHFHLPNNTLDAGTLEAALRLEARLRLGCGDAATLYGLEELLQIAENYFPVIGQDQRVRLTVGALCACYFTSFSGRRCGFSHVPDHFRN
jgi:hypothetical protein